VEVYIIMQPSIKIFYIDKLYLLYLDTLFHVSCFLLIPASTYYLISNTYCSALRSHLPAAQQTRWTDPNILRPTKHYGTCWPVHPWYLSKKRLNFHCLTKPNNKNKKYGLSKLYSFMKQNIYYLSRLLNDFLNIMQK